MSSVTTFPQIETIRCPLCGAIDGRYSRRGYYIKCATCRVAFRPGDRIRQQDEGASATGTEADDLDQYWQTAFWTEEEIEKRKQREPVFRHAFELLSRATMSTIAPDTYLANGSSVLDIGCGIGTFLAVCRQGGWQVTGVEPSPIACQVARREYGLELINKPFSSALFPEQRFDAVFAAQVLHHLPDPVSFITDVDRVLAPHGLLMLRTPNLIALEPSLFLQRLLRRKESFFCGPALYVFHPQSLKLLLQRLGYHQVTFINSRPYVEKTARHTSTESRVRRHLTTALKLATYNAVQTVYRVSNGHAVIGPSIFVIARKA